MFCTKCGMKIEDGSVFCQFCGSKVQNDMQNEANVENAQAINEEVNSEVSENSDEEMNTVNYENTVNTEEVTDVAEDNVNSQEIPDMSDFIMETDKKAKKKSKKGLKFGLISVAAVLIVAIVLDFALWGNIKNIFYNVGPANKQLSHIYVDGAETLASETAEAYDNLFKNENKFAMGNSGSINLELSKDIKDILAIANLGDLKSVNIDYVFDIDENQNVCLKAAVKENNEDLVSAEAYLDIKNEKIVINLPGLVDKPLEIELPKELEDEIPSMSLFTGSALSQVDFSSLPDSHFVENLITELTEAIIGEIKSVEREKKEFSASSVKQKATCLEVEVDTDLIADMLNAAIDVLESKKEIPDMLKGFAKDNSDLEIDENIADEWKDFLSEAKEEIKEIYDVDQDLFTVCTYVNFSNEIVAIEIDAEIEGEKMFFFMGTAQDGDEMGIEISAKLNGEKVFAIDGAGDIKSDKFSGDIGIEVQGDELLKIKVKDFDLNTIEDGYINGGFEIITGRDIEKYVEDSKSELGFSITDISVAFDIATNKETQSISISPVFKGMNLGKLSIKNKYTEDVSVKIPSNTVKDANEWSSSIDLNKLQNKLASSSMGTLIISLISSYEEESYEEEEIYFDDSYYDDDYGFDYDETYDDDYSFDYDETYDDDYSFDYDETYDDDYSFNYDETYDDDYSFDYDDSCENDDYIFDIDEKENLWGK